MKCIRMRSKLHVFKDFECVYEGIHTHTLTITTPIQTQIHIALWLTLMVSCWCVPSPLQAVHTHAICHSVYFDSFENFACMPIGHACIAYINLFSTLQMTISFVHYLVTNNIIRSAHPVFRMRWLLRSALIQSDMIYWSKYAAFTFVCKLHLSRFVQRFLRYKFYGVERKWNIA